MLKTVGFPSTRTGDQTIIDGNEVIATAGKGVNFTANTPAAGMTSQLLNWYEEGTWTPTVTPLTSGTITLNTSHNQAAYTRVGRVVTVTGELIVSSVSSPVGTGVVITLPFTVGNPGQRSGYAAGAVMTGTSTAPVLSRYLAISGNSSFDIYVNASTVVSDTRFDFSFSYFV